jgi:hypothetical protein
VEKAVIDLVQKLATSMLSCGEVEVKNYTSPMAHGEGVTSFQVISSPSYLSPGHYILIRKEQDAD